jgi:cysteinyl-tRNA synthetase
LLSSDVLFPGADLKFPHHDNELAQAEACFDCKQWVNYFLHSGHLDIDGLKMSKSLKNFITIKDTLNKFKYTPRQLRLLFLLQAWDSKMNYQVKDTMVEVDAKDKAFTEFFNKVKVIAAQREENLVPNESWNPKDVQLHEALLAAQKAVHAALSTNFNTSDALNALTDIVSKANAYLSGNTAKKGALL